MRLAPLTALLLGLASLPGLAQTSLEARVIVRWKSEAPVVRAKALAERSPQHVVSEVVQRRADALGQRAGLRMLGSSAIDTRTHVVTASGIDSISLAKRLRMDPSIEFAIVDRIRRTSAVPNDALYANGGNGNGQWFLKTPTAEVRSAINAEAAWNIGTNASNVVVAVIDTGVRPEHPDLRANLVAGYDVIGIGSTGSVANAVANDGDLADADPSDPGDWINQADIDLGRLGSDCTSDDIGSSSWHGTRVAGLIGAVGNNGLGVAGVFWSGKISTVRALGKCGGYDSDIWRGIRWAVGADVPGLPSNANPARVVNMSLGGSGRCTGDDGIAYTDAIREANLRGAVVVVAAGNSNGGPVDNPANCKGAIAVAGLRHAGTKVGLSSMGVEVALSAPAGNCVNATGACLYTMLSTTNSGSEGPGLDTYTDTAASVGTSFAAPLVAGTAALMLSRNPSLSADDVRRILRETARPFPSQGAEAAVGSCSEPVTVDTGECYCTQSTCGAGMLDTSAAVLAAATKGGPPVVSVSGAPTSVTVGNSVTLTGTASVSAGRTIRTYAWTITSGTNLATFSGATNTSTATLLTSGPGSVTVQLTVTDDTGASQSASLTLVVTAAPPPPANNGGGGGSSSPLWLALLGLAALRARR